MWQLGEESVSTMDNEGNYKLEVSVSVENYARISPSAKRDMTVQVVRVVSTFTFGGRALLSNLTGKKSINISP